MQNEYAWYASERGKFILDVSRINQHNVTICSETESHKAGIIVSLMQMLDTGSNKLVISFLLTVPKAGLKHDLMWLARCCEFLKDT